MMRILFRSCFLSTLILACGVAPALANSLVNPSFENPITYDGAPFVGFWEGFNGDAVSSSANNDIMPRTGGLSLLLTIANTDNSFAGAFQDVPGLIPGTIGTFSGWHKTLTSPLNVGIEFRIEWRSSVGNNEVSRTPNMTTVPTGAYTEFSLAAAVPAGADTARVVYAIQSFGRPNPAALGNGQVLVDDASFVAVPEPASLAIVGMAGLALAALRRRA